MFVTRKNMGAILGSFTKVLNDLEVLVEQRESEISVSQENIQRAQLLIEQNDGEIKQANKIRNNIEKLLT